MLNREDYVNKNLMDEETYRAWFNDYLGEIETELSSNLQSSIINAPKMFNFWKLVVILSIITVVCMGLSLMFYLIPNLQNDWVSNACLSIGTGIIASIIIFLLRKEKKTLHI